jgi:hypothetical protein
MGPFECQPLTRAELARQLAEAGIVASRAIPGATLYQLKSDPRGEWLLVALPDGTGLTVDLAKPPTKRRRVDQAQPGEKLSPASR